MKYSQSKNFKKFFLNFYTKDLYKVVKYQNRGYIESQALILARYIIILLVGLIINNADQLSSADKNFQFLEKLTVYNQLSSDEYIFEIVQAFLAISATIIFIFKFILLLYLIDYFTFKQISTFQTKKKYRSNHMYILLKKSLSVLISLFGYVLFIPSLYFSFKDIKEPVSMINIGLSLIVGLIFADTDYNYAFQSLDGLASLFSNYSFSFFLIEAMFILILQFVSNLKALLLFIFMIFEIIRLIQRPYYDLRSQKSALFYAFYIFSLSISVIISQQLSKNNTLISFLSCLLLPLSYLASKRIVFKYEQIINGYLQYSFTSEEIEIQKLDRLMRLPVFQQSKQLETVTRKNHKYIKQLNFILNKLKSNIQQKTSNNNNLEEQFQVELQKYNENIQIDEIYSQKTQKQIKKLLILALKDLFYRTMKSKKNQSSKQRDQIIFYVFIIEVIGSLRQYWILREQAKSNRLMSPKQTQLCNSVEKTIFEQKAEILKIANNNNVYDPFSQEYIEVIKYEKQLEETVVLFDQVIKYKVDVLLRMKQKFIDLEELIKDIDKFLQSNEKLKKNLNQLTLINSENHVLYELQHLYLEILAFAEKDIYIPKFGQILSNKVQSQRNKKKMNSLVERFDKHTCIVAAQFEDSGALTVKHVSKNFSDVFFTLNSNQDIINKNIDQIIPYYLHSYHRKYVNKFIESKQSINMNSDKSSKMVKKMIFGALSNTLIIPLQIEIKLNQFINNQDFGLCAKVTLVNHNKHYILYQTNSYMILGITPRLSKLLFPNRESILKTNIKSYFPIISSYDLNELQAHQENNEQIEYENVKNTEFLFIKRINSQSPLKNSLNSQKNPKNMSKQSQYISNNLQTTNFSRAVKSVVKEIKNQETVNSAGTGQLEDDYIFIIMNLRIHEINYQMGQNYGALEVVSVKQVTLNNNSYMIQNHIKNQLAYFKSKSNSLDYHLQLSIKQLDNIYSEIKNSYLNQNSNISLSSNISQSFVESNLQAAQQNNAANFNSLVQNIQNQCQNELTDRYQNELSAERDREQNISFLVSNLHNTNSNIEQINKENAKQFIKNPEDQELNRKDDDESNIYKTGFHDQSNYQKINNFDQNSSQVITTRRGLIDRLDESNAYAYDNDGIESGLISHLAPHHDYQAQTRDKSDTFLPLISKKQNDENSHKIKSAQSEFNQNETIGSQNLTVKGNKQKQNNNPSSFSNQQKEQIQDSLLTNDSRTIQPNIIIKTHNQNGDQTAKSRGNLNIEEEINNKQQKFYSDDQSISENRNHQIEQLLKRKFTQNQQISQYAKMQSMKSTKNDFNPEEVMTNRKRQILKQIIDKQADIVSTSSKKSTFAAAKRSLRQILSDKHIPFAIKLSNFIGLFSFMTMTTIVMIQYFKLSDQIYTSKEDKYYSTWPVDFQASVYSLVKYNNIIYALNGKKDYKFPTDDIKNAFINRTKSDLMFKKDQVINLIAQSSGEQANRLTFQLLKENPNTFQIGQYYDPKNLTKSSSVPAKYNFFYVNYTNTIHFSIVLSYQHTFRYAVGLGTGRPEYYMILNNLNFYYSLNNVQKELLSIQQDRDNELQNELVQVMILIIVISGVCVGIIIPLYAYIQSMREEVVYLFSTFNSQKLDEMLSNIKQDYEYQRKQFQINGQAIKFTNIKDDQQKKNAKNISVTTKLRRVKGSLIFKLLIIFCLIIIYPIVNKLVTQEYLTQQTISLRTTLNMYKLKGYISSVLALHYNNIYMKMYPTVKPIRVENYLNDIKILLDQQDSQQQDIQQILEEQGSIKRYRQDLYDDFFFSALKSNLCDVFSKYPQYISNTTIIDINSCSTRYKGFLQKGFQLALKEYLSIFPNLYNVYLMQNATDYNPILKSWTESFDIKDFTAYQEFLEETLVSLKDFILKISQEYFENITKLQLGLFIYQITFMAFIFIFGWMRFCVQLHRQLLITKKYLQVIDITSLLENSYILTFIKKNNTL